MVVTFEKKRSWVNNYIANETRGRRLTKKQQDRIFKRAWREADKKFGK